MTAIVGTSLRQRPRQHAAPRQPQHAPPLDCPTRPGFCSARLGPASLPWLQRTAGNAAVADLLAHRADATGRRCGRLSCVRGCKAAMTRIGPTLQRQSPVLAAPSAAKLSDAQVAAAIAYYRAQPGKYSKAIIRELQARLQVTVTGTMDADTVRAVARVQAAEPSTPKLKIDGKAGPRTLPRLFPNGLNAPGAAVSYAGTADSELFAHWADLATPEARLIKLAELVNRSLAAAGVPAVDVVGVDGAAGGPNGQFEPHDWVMSVSKERFKDPVPTGKTRRLVRTVYHEARHAQQSFMIARMLAGKGHPSAAAIRARMRNDIKLSIAAEARDRFLPAGSMQAVIAEGWYDSEYGDFAEHRVRVLNEIAAAGRAVCRAHTRARAHPDDPKAKAAEDGAKARFNRAYDRYQDLPEENDAFATVYPIKADKTTVDEFCHANQP